MSPFCLVLLLKRNLFRYCSIYVGYYPFFFILFYSLSFFSTIILFASQFFIFFFLFTFLFSFFLILPFLFLCSRRSRLKCCYSYSSSSSSHSIPLLSFHFLCSSFVQSIFALFLCSCPAFIAFFWFIPPSSLPPFPPSQRPPDPLSSLPHLP